MDCFWKPLIQNSWSTVENVIRKKCSGLSVSEKLSCYWALKWGCSIWQVASASVNGGPLAASMKIYSSCIKLRIWKTAVCAWILVAAFRRDSACTVLPPAGKYAEILHVIAALVFCGMGWICVLASDVKKRRVLFCVQRQISHSAMVSGYAQISFCS